MSVVSTVSSGSASSRDDIGPPAAPLTAEDDLELDLCPPAESSETQDIQRLPPERQNTHGAAAVPSVIPFASKAMAPNPQLTYLDRVVTEIIETERMYVRDLRSIVEVTCLWFLAAVNSIYIPPISHGGLRTETRCPVSDVE